MSLRPDEISRILKSQIVDFRSEVEVSDGTASAQVTARPVRAENAMAGFPAFPGDTYGMVLNLKKITLAASFSALYPY